MVAVDGYLPLGAVTATLAADLALLEPVGQGNAGAAFYARASTAADSRRVFKNAHVELWLTDGPYGVRGVGFNLASAVPLVDDDGEWGVVFTPVVGTWNAGAKVELRLKHAAPVGPGAGKPFDLTDRRGALPGEAWADFDAGEDAVYGFPRGEGGFVIPYGDEKENGRRFRRVFVATPPFEPLRLAAVAAAADELILAFNADDVAAATAFLAAYYPDRKTLEDVYRTRSGGNTVGLAGVLGLARARAIFAELGLAGEAAESGAGDGAKKALASSPLFARCERLRGAGVAFVTAAARWPAATWAAVARSLRGDNP